MKIKNVMLFCYDFPHKKTQDFIVRLLTEGYKISYVIGAPWKKLPISKSSVRLSPTHEGLIHPRKLCQAFGINYVVMDHSSPETEEFIKKNLVDLCIISGARILPKEIIRACSNKILNLHPGLLPQVRGLDTILWSIYFDLPLGITAHFISPKIDKGVVIYKEKLKLNTDDTIFDVSQRLLEKQEDVLLKAIDLLKQDVKLENIDFAKSPYNTKMDPGAEKNAMEKFPIWLKKYATVV